MNVLWNDESSFTIRTKWRLLTTRSMVSWRLSFSVQSFYLSMFSVNLYLDCLVVHPNELFKNECGLAHKKLEYPCSARSQRHTTQSACNSRHICDVGGADQHINTFRGWSKTNDTHSCLQTSSICRLLLTHFISLHQTNDECTGNIYIHTMCQILSL